MEILYRQLKEYDQNQLKELFLSLHWESGNYPERLVKAMKHSGCVFSAWDGEKLIGLINGLDDGEMTAYVHYLLVDPKYQKEGVGKRLMELLKEYYHDYLKIVLNSYQESVGFYEKCGFETDKNIVPLFLGDVHTNWQKKV